MVELRPTGPEWTAGLREVADAALSYPYLDAVLFVLGVTREDIGEAPEGSMAAYKAAELVRRLRERGCEVQVAMTASAMEFVRPLTFQAIIIWRDELVEGKVLLRDLGKSLRDDERLASALLPVGGGLLVAVRR